MAEGMTEVQVKGFEGAGILFDELVEEKLRGDQVEVVVVWEDQEKGQTEESHSTPHVTINGTPAWQYCRSLMEWSTHDEALIDETAAQFEVTMAMLWSNTIDYYEELDSLVPVMDSLALSETARFRKQATAEFTEDGITPLTDDVLQRARLLACAAFESWVDAVTEKQAEETGSDS